MINTGNRAGEPYDNSVLSRDRHWTNEIDTIIWSSINDDKPPPVETTCRSVSVLEGRLQGGCLKVSLSKLRNSRKKCLHTRSIDVCKLNHFPRVVVCIVAGRPQLPSGRQEQEHHYVHQPSPAQPSPAQPGELLLLLSWEIENSPDNCYSELQLRGCVSISIAVVYKPIMYHVHVATCSIV